MEEELIVDPQFQKGFNHGYILAEHEPELAKEITASNNSHDIYFSGLVSGKEEFDMEKIRDRSKDVNQNKTIIKNIEKDKGRMR